MPFPPLCESLFKPRIRDTPTSMPHKSCVKKTLGIKNCINLYDEKKKNTVGCAGAKPIHVQTFV